MITIDGFVIDATLRETHSFESEVTQYPVESGATITDNVRPLPIKVELEGIVSDSPLPGPIADARGDTDSDGKLLHVPSDDALAALKAIYEAREPITIDTSLKRYENMAMTSLEIPRDAETGHALSFTAAFQQIQFVTNNRATIKVSPPLATALGAKKDIGNKNQILFKQRDGHLIIWHHTSPRPIWSTSEVLGFKRSDVSEGRNALYHANGQPLSDAEFEQWQQDQALWFKTHNADGTQILSGDNALAAGNKLTTLPNGFPIPVFDNGNGDYVDASGHPVSYAPNYGNWIRNGE